MMAVTKHQLLLWIINFQEQPLGNKTKVKDYVKELVSGYCRNGTQYIFELSLYLMLKEDLNNNLEIFVKIYEYELLTVGDSSTDERMFIRQYIYMLWRLTHLGGVISLSIVCRQSSVFKMIRIVVFFFCVGYGILNISTLRSRY